MIGSRQQAQSALFYEFLIETHDPAGHMLRAVDRFVYLAGVRQDLVPFYSSTGRPSVDPELTIRMLLVGYIMGLRSERRLSIATAAAMTDQHWMVEVDVKRCGLVSYKSRKYALVQ